LAATAANTNLLGEFFYGRKHIISWFDVGTCSKVIEDGVIAQNTYDFLLEFYSNFGRISYFPALQSILCRNKLLGDCDL